MLTERRHLILELTVPFLAAAALNLLLHLLVVQSKTFPLPRLFPSAITTGKYLAFQEALRRTGSIDVLITGLSPLMRVSGRDLGHRLGAAKGTPVHVFNFSGPQHGPLFTHILLSDLVTPMAKPTVVVHGIMPLDVLLEPGSEESYRRVVSQYPVFVLHARSPVARLRGFLLTHVDLFAYRNVIREWLAGVARVDPWDRRARSFDQWGDTRFAPDRRVNALAPYEQRYVERLRGFPRLLDHTRLFAHLRSLAEWCERHDIHFVLINTPVHPMFARLLPHGMQDYQEFVHRLYRLVSEARILFFDPAGGAFADPNFFNDTHHLNQRGADWLTPKLADFLLAHGLPPTRSTDGN